MNFSKYTNKTTEESLQELNSSINGLSKKEAESRQKTFGLNEVKSKNINALEVLQKTLTDLSDYNVKEADNVKIQNEKIITTLFRY